MNRDVVVALESSDLTNRKLLSEGGRIANHLGGTLFALLAEPASCGSAAWVRTANHILDKTPFRLLLFAHSDKGRELAPMIAQALGAAAVMDCFDIRYRNGDLHYARYVYGGQFEQEVSFAHPPEIASLNLDSVMAEESVSANMIHMQISGDADANRAVTTIPPDFKTVDIRYAKRLLDIGAGCDQPAGLKSAEELSELLEASIGTTRLVVDSGHIARIRMIGQTGKSISPEFCLTLGVSGSPHHVAGLRQSGKIFSVNSDARAPIFGVSDAGFVMDLGGLLPKLIHRIKQFRDKGLT